MDKSDIMKYLIQYRKHRCRVCSIRPHLRIETVYFNKIIVNQRYKGIELRDQETIFLVDLNDVVGIDLAKSMMLKNIDIQYKAGEHVVISIYSD